jgi:hypothetical protein
MKQLKKLRQFIPVLLLLLAASAIISWVWREVKIDACLDNGGRWNSEKLRCEGAAP